VPSEAFNQVVELLRASPVKPVSASFEESRAVLDALGADVVVPADVTVTAVEIAGVPCERSVPANAGPVTLLYLHGGAYTAGSLVSHRALVARLARAAGGPAVAVDYRLAPEHPFPAGLDDARAVYLRLLADGAAPGAVVVAGDSAGGGLATALLLSLRDAGEPLPAGAVLLSPWLDLTLAQDSMATRAGEDPLLRPEALAVAAAAYAEDRARPLVSPLFADPAGLPPLLILVGTAEILLDDSRLFADRARAADVEVDIDVEQDMIHVWPFLDGVPEAAAAMARIAAWVAARTA
jgi:monoterpene epsilon-lactone hydrolase